MVRLSPSRDRNPAARDGATPWQGDDPCSRCDKGARPAETCEPCETYETREAREACATRRRARREDLRRKMTGVLERLRPTLLRGRGDTTYAERRSAADGKCRNSRYVDHLKTGTRGPPSPLRTRRAATSNGAARAGVAAERSPATATDVRRLVRCARNSVTGSPRAFAGAPRAPGSRRLALDGLSVAFRLASRGEIVSDERSLE